ncbi:MAG TPA: DUF4124 domain-containing protein [Gammaproteobacteria bacterium]|mgnify:CR=1 FL=1|nr:DUF4124 domain-containing protein [Gammaproteobacteria bacterium]
MPMETITLKKGLLGLGFLLTIFSGFAHISALAEEEQYMYRWIDDNGTVTYSQTSPTDGREVTKVNKASVPKYENTQFGDKKDWSEQEKAMQRRLKAEKDKKDNAADDKRVKEHNKKVCDQMRKNMAVLETRNQVRRVVDGKRVMMTEEERQAMIVQVKKTLQECDAK